MDFQALLAKTQQKLAALRGSVKLPFAPGAPKPAAPKPILPVKPQLTKATVSVPFKPYTPKPVIPDNSVTGILKNTVQGLPKAGVDVRNAVGRGVVNMGQGAMRAYATVVPTLHKVGSVPADILNPQGKEARDRARESLTLTPKGQFQEDLFGTNEKITARSVGEEIPLLKGAAIAPVVGFASGASDLIPGGGVAKNLVVKGLQNANEVASATKILSSAAGMSPDIARKYGEAAAKLTDPKQLDTLVDAAVRESQDAVRIAKKGFEGFSDLTTKTLEKLKGRTTVSRQFIEDMTNAPDLKQAERDLIRRVLGEGDTGEVFYRGGDKGRWITDDPEFAKEYGNVSEIRLNKKPNLLNTASDEADQIADELDADPLDLWYNPEESVDEILKSKGYDGFVNDEKNIYLVDENLIRRGDSQINVPEFANRVKGELLPLDTSRPGDFKKGNRPGESAPETWYESITLPDELRGPVANYHERIYQSPIKTSAGDVHFQSSNAPNYFAHSRIEDLPADGSTVSRKKLGEYDGREIYGQEFGTKSDGKVGTTRRVIEIQSDLFQKGRLEGEVPTYTREQLEETRRAIDAKPEDGGVLWDAKEKARVIKDQEALFEKAEARKAEIAKLEPYRNTWHERVIREEVKKAAQDGKTKLQFPTGETAMKIEGLGQTDNWYLGDDISEALANPPLTPEKLEVGQVVSSQGSGDGWIITDVLGDGKFKAVPQRVWNDRLASHEAAKRAVVAQGRNPDEVLGSFPNDTVLHEAEQFDISGKVDTENPIYKFYDKTVAKYLKNKYGAKEVTDAQGVKWMEIDVDPAKAKAPVEAYGMAAGIEPEFDENGKLKDIKFNPVSAGAGLVGVGVAKRVADSNLLKKPLSEADRLIVEGKIRVVRRGEYDVYQTKVGNKWVNARDESSAVAKVTRPPLLKKKHENPKVAELAQKVEEDRIMIDLAEQSLSEHPGALLKKYVKRGKGAEFEGKLPDLKEHSTLKLNKKGHQYKDTRNRWEREGDSIFQEVMNNSEGTYGSRLENVDEAQDVLDDYITRKNSIEDLKGQLKAHKAELAEARKSQHLKFDEDGFPLPYTAKEKAILKKVQKVESPAPKAPLLKKSEGEVRSYEKIATPPVKDPPLPPEAKALEDVIESTPVKNKVNAIDYLRTPDRVLKKLGLEKEATEIRRSFDAYHKELPKNIDKITSWSKRVPRDANQRIFRYLDGEAIDLAPKEREVAIEIKDWLRAWADRMKLPKEGRVSEYITHLFDDQLIKKEFDEDLAKIIQDKIPGSVYNPFLQKRLGTKGYKQDTWAALDAYVKRATRKVHMDHALERLEVASSKLEESQWNYVKRYADRINLRPTEIDNIADNTIKSLVGYRLGQRPTANVTRTARQMVYRAMLGLNPGSALRNLSQGANVYAKLGEKYTAVGYAKLFSPSARKELKASGILDNNFIQDRAMTATKKAVEKMDKGLFVFFDTAEKINRGAAYLGAKSRGLSKGMSNEQAVEYAKKIVRQTQFQYDQVDTPVAMSSDIVKTLTQFGTYPVKQTEFLAEMVKNKEWAGLVRYSAAGMLFVYTVGQALGMEPDELLPLGSFQRIVEDGPPLGQLAGTVGGAVFDTPDDYGNKRTLSKKMEDVGKVALTHTVPAGVQIRKSWMGTEAVLKGGSVDKSGRLQYPIGGGLLKNTQAAVFGKSSTKEAKEYYRDREKPKEKTILDKKAAERAEYRITKIRPIYNEVQKLVREGREEDAQRIVDSLSETDYDEYVKIRSSEKAEQTKKLQVQLIPTYEKVQRLKNAGDIAGAQRIVDAMTEDEYHAYTLLKDKLQ